jgi:UrcA family protein
MTMNTQNTAIRNRFDVRSLVLTTFATACLAVAATAVHAAEQARDSAPMMQTVMYSDLNLANPQGVERLYRRIVAAAQQVCDSRQGRSLQAQAMDSICTKQSIAHAVAAVGQPALSSLHAVKTGQSDGTARLAKQ